MMVSVQLESLKKLLQFAMMAGVPEDLLDICMDLSAVIKGERAKQHIYLGFGPGKKIATIKVFRQLTDENLKDAKERAETFPAVIPSDWALPLSEAGATIKACKEYIKECRE